MHPVDTYSTNVMGTVNILEVCRTVKSVKSVINVTTDKVYENKEWSWGYRENENLCGYDPYSNSKSCSELVTFSYKNSFFNGEISIALVNEARSLISPIYEFICFSNPIKLNKLGLVDGSNE